MPNLPFNEQQVQSNATSQQIVSWYTEDEISITELRRRTGMSYKKIRGILRAAQVVVRLPNKLLPGQAGTLVADYLAGMGSGELSEKYGICPARVLEILCDRGIQRRSNSQAKRCHTLNEAIFDELTEEARYWIGFLMADGNVFQKGGSHVVQLRLAEKDSSHVEAFRLFLGSSHPIRRIPGQRIQIGNRPPANGGPSVHFSVSSRRLGDALIRHGVTPRKSQTAQAKGDLGNDPSFWRGVMDGDGTLGIYEGGGKRGLIPVLGMCGSHPLMTQFSLFARLQSPDCAATVVFRSGVHRARVSGYHAVVLLQKLYDGATISLPRKRTIAERILAEFSDQSRTPSATFDGKTQTLKRWAIETGIDYHTLYYRIVKKGWPAEKALRTPAILGRNQHSG